MSAKIKTVIFFISLILVSCVTPLGSSEEPVPPENPNVPMNDDALIPLSTGTQWAYKHITSSEEENHLYRVEDLFPLTVGTNIYTVYEMTGPVTGYSGTLSLFLDFTTRGFYNSSAGFYSVTGYSSQQLTNSIWFKYPCRAGDAYGTYTVNSISSSVVNNYLGRTINCIHYISNDGNFQNEYFVSPGLGIVKAVMLNGSHIFEMTGYTIN